MLPPMSQLAVPLVRPDNPAEVATANVLLAAAAAVWFLLLPASIAASIAI
jgi:hypothetical protein